MWIVWHFGTIPGEADDDDDDDDGDNESAAFTCAETRRAKRPASAECAGLLVCRLRIGASPECSSSPFSLLIFGIFELVTRPICYECVQSSWARGLGRRDGIPLEITLVRPLGQ